MPRGKIEEKECVVCGNVFETRKKTAHVCGGPYGACSKEMNRRKHIGKSAWNKGMDAPYSKDTLAKMSAAHLGRKLPLEQVAKIVASNTGKKRGIGFRKFMSNRHKGERNPFYKDGSSIGKARLFSETGLGSYSRWRAAVLERDNKTCVSCSSKENIEVDHIKPYAWYPEIKWELSNGQCLCRPCHKAKTNTERKLSWKNQYTQSPNYIPKKTD